MQSPSPMALALKIIIVWLIILPVAGFWYTISKGQEPVGMKVLPEMPRPGVPIIVTFTMENPAGQDETVDYGFYVDGNLLAEGTTNLPPNSGKTFQYVRRPNISIGERLSFAVKVITQGGIHERVISLPAYPPQVWSSFVSFAAFSTSVMSSLITTSYYSGFFDARGTPNIGLVMVSVLVAVLIFLEMSHPFTEGEKQSFSTRLGALRLRFGRVTIILLIVFAGMVFTRGMLIFSKIMPTP